MKKNKKRFYQLLFSFTILFVVVSLMGLWVSQSRVDMSSSGDMMNSGPTMGLSMMKYMFSNMSLTQMFTPMAHMMDMMQGMMSLHPLYDVLNIVLTLLLALSTAVLIGTSIILIMLWV